MSFLHRPLPGSNFASRLRRLHVLLLGFAAGAFTMTAVIVADMYLSRGPPTPTLSLPPRPPRPLAGPKGRHPP